MSPNCTLTLQLLALCVASLSRSVHAQSRGAEVGSFTAGRNYAGPAVSLSGVGTSPVIGGNFEHAKGKNLGLGAFVARWSYSESQGGATGSIGYLALGGTASYHFDVPDGSRWDPFVGGALGYYIVSASSEIEGLGEFSAAESRLATGAFAGGRYFLSPSLSLVGRAGLGVTYLSLGVDFQF